MDDFPPAARPDAAAFCPCELVAAGGDPAFLVICDHAANALPPGYGTLGLPDTEFARHIAYDIGAAGVARALARALGAPAVLARFSRLLVDLNRGEDDPTIVMKLSDGAVVPANRDVDASRGAEEFGRRIAMFHAPYHAAVAAALDRALAAGVVPVVISVHSFTPAWRGRARPWHSGILWDRDDRLAAPLIAGLRAEPGLVVGDNEPYTGRLKNDCLYRHGTARGLPHALIEIRQDLIESEAGQIEWAERYAQLLRAIAAGPGIREIRHFGSHSGAVAPISVG
ncbi:MAG: N-formylglutamate amidohydrolase [Parvibaculum sp.]|uniref:N-formylglutamate amidohydrolase n=1 Tax=Parvibaculum sp. TaxID=2024848 RepID=UPI0027206AB5|nr:N-formylglutamate amidohydrolase [Parvibaculum sp.]MDO8838044.1 N-formylglutamate amidohydrolase [Parvibaculum sp.]